MLALGNGTQDTHAGRSGDVGNGQVQMHIHLHEHFVHHLQQLGRLANEVFAMPPQGA